MQVTKRDGACVLFDGNKIRNAISKAYSATHDGHVNEKRVCEITQAVIDEIGIRDKISVEEIQDIVELKLMEFDEFSTARSYILHRQKHKIRREAGTRLMNTYKEIFFTDAENADFKRDNANINTNASMGMMLKLGTEGAKYFVDNYVLPEEFVQADREHFVHYHDKDFSLITLNCCQIDLLKLFKGGFSTGHGFLREPNSIRSYASLACISVQSNQNDMFGGQSINAFDYAMAEGVKKSFKKAILSEVERLISFYPDRYDFSTYEAIKTAAPCGYGNKATIAALNEVLNDETLAKKIYWMACADVEEETHQAMEAVIHNFNSLHSRAGSQVPFSSINYGMDTSPEGRLVIREVLNAIDAGLGNGETPIFPISVFQLKSGVNYNVDDPNYDLFKLACKVSAKRLYPNFLSIDSSFNLPYYREGDYNSYVATMGKCTLSPSV